MIKPIEFFTAEDFKGTESVVSSQHTWLYDYEAAAIANAKLLNNAKVVYAEQTAPGKPPWFSERESFHTHSALLVNIQPIQPCKHEPKEMTSAYDSPNDPAFRRCKHCRIELVAETIWKPK